MLSDGWTGLPVLCGGRWRVAQAGFQPVVRGEWSRHVRVFGWFGAATGGRDEPGLPIRLDWARNDSGVATGVHGHVAEPDVRERNNVLCIDTGCCFGGHLTAMRWPERKLVQVPAHKEWFNSPRWPTNGPDG